LDAPASISIQRRRDPGISGDQHRVQAEFGQAGGGLVNSVTKSGGNIVTRDGYYSFSTAAFSATIHQ